MSDLGQVRQQKKIFKKPGDCSSQANKYCKKEQRQLHTDAHMQMDKGWQ